jgi:hypothetical protein
VFLNAAMMNKIIQIQPKIFALAIQRVGHDVDGFVEKNQKVAQWIVGE